MLPLWFGDGEVVRFSQSAITQIDCRDSSGLEEGQIDVWMDAASLGDGYLLNIGATRILGENKYQRFFLVQP